MPPKDDTPMKKELSIILVGLLSTMIFAQKSWQVLPFTDSADFRKTCIETWFNQDVNILEKQLSEVGTNRLGEQFLIRAERDDDYLKIIVSPLVKKILEIEVRTDSNLETNAERIKTTKTLVTMWPEDAFGAWVLYKDAFTGKNIKIRYYLMQNPQVYVDIFYQKDKCFASFVVFDAIVSKNIPLPLPFSRFFSLSVQDFYNLTTYLEFWDYLVFFKGFYEDNMYMASFLHSFIKDNDVKKIINRDKGQSLVELIKSGLKLEIPDETRVESTFFTAYKYDKKIIDYGGLFFEKGYAFKMLSPLMYLLAIAEPDTFFIGEFEVLGIQHEAVFFPFFSSDGVFNCSVFCGENEYNLDDFLKKYDAFNIILQRVKASRQFYPQVEKFF